MFIEYCCGFMFDEKRDFVGLIEKQKPDWQKGKFNGIGGKLNPSEPWKQGQVREFYEETGVIHDGWEQFVTYWGKGFCVHFFRAFTDKLHSIKSMEDEIVHRVNVDALFDPNLPFQKKLVNNLNWLIPLALDENVEPSTILILGKDTT